jgi:hypothetical protein
MHQTEPRSWTRACAVPAARSEECPRFFDVHIFGISPLRRQVPIGPVFPSRSPHSTASARYVRYRTYERKAVMDDMHISMGGGPP